MNAQVNHLLGLRQRIFGGALIAALVLGFGAFFGKVACTLLSPPPLGTGAPAPDFSLRSPLGAPGTLSAHAGKIVLLDFWQTTCVGCVGATPKLNRLQRKNAARGFTVLGINQPPDTEEAVLDFVDRRALEYPVLMDEGEVARAYGVFAFPTVILIDREGKIRARYRGPVTERALQSKIDSCDQPWSAER